MIADNKRIAKNSIYLYLRSFIAMAISVYTSRVVLQALGVIDFGIYNIVAGVVGSLTMITGPVGNAVSRFITFAYGKNDYEMVNKVYSASINIVFVISIIVFFVGLISGYYIIYYFLNIPSNRLNAALWSFFFVIITFSINIFQIPIKGLIIANEKMNFYAYLGILESILKLVIAYLLSLSSKDELIFYSILIMLQSILILSVAILYNKRNFCNVKYILKINKSIYKELFSFVSFTILTGITFIIKNQGIDMLLNLYFGPIVNAAKAIAGQIQNAASVLGNGLQTAGVPQIVKKYSSRDFHEMLTLTFRLMRFSSFLMLMTIFPLYLHTEYVVKLWLGEIPRYSVEFIQMSLLIVFVDTLSLPLHNGILASGKIKTYSSIISFIQMLNLPISFIYLKFGYPPVIVMFVLVLTSLLILFTRFFCLNLMVKISLRTIVIPNLIHLIIVIVTLCLLSRFVIIQNINFMCFSLNIIIEIVLVSVVSIVFGCKRSEQKAIIGKIIRVL